MTCTELLRTVLPAPFWPTMMVSGLKNSMTSVLSGAKLRMPLIDSCPATGCVSTAATYAEKHTEVQMARHPALGEAHLVYAAHCTHVGTTTSQLFIQLRSAVLCFAYCNGAVQSMQDNVQLGEACCLLRMLCCSRAHVHRFCGTSCLIEVQPGGKISESFYLHPCAFGRAHGALSKPSYDAFMGYTPDMLNCSSNGQCSWHISLASGSMLRWRHP